jgi:hypothetical protein
MLGVSFWESEEALRATDEAASSVRSGAAEAADGTVAGVEEYEVFVNEAPSAGPLGAVTGTVGGVTDTVGGATQPVSGATDTVAGHGHAGRDHGQPPGGRREEGLAKGGQQAPTREGGPAHSSPAPFSPLCTREETWIMPFAKFARGDSRSSGARPCEA